MSATTNHTTNEIVELLRNKSREGFNMLYDEYGPTLYGIICKIVKETAVAEDVLQEAFVKVWKNIQHYDSDKGSFFTWLLNITRYTAIDYLRSRNYKQWLKTFSVTDNVSIEENAVMQPGTETAGLKAVVSRLEPKYREVIDLVYFWGYTQDEVSKLLQIPLGTVKTRARTALQILRNQFCTDEA